MKYLKSVSVCICLLSCMLSAKAQEFMHYTDSRPVLVIDNTDIGGTPYLYNDWQPGYFTLTNGFTSKEPLMLKFNMVKDMLSYKDPKTGVEMEFVQPVQEFTLKVSQGDGAFMRRFKTGYINIEDSTPASFFELISDGKVQLIKRTKKELLETFVIGAPTKERKFIEKFNRYYLVIDGKPIPIKKDKKSILTALNSKQTQLDSYIKVNSLNLKTDADLSKLIDYFNTL
ncbi:hypothetical protein [Mucilaginibacter glaciei]|uniref:GLPGLI family protein n=1 Tax=Mucilaginibacter glaciei TaxID=2772109 RepID=A0A926NGY4_9SPHI|nr:hypothetical protein [Mucilaginibacter glaciei]MBD1391889.1 hypothetical protein [Mucilaginibacter glaciei]